jgi:hypothetical protein
LRRVLAVAAGVAMVPALYAVATAATGGGGSPSAVTAAARGADDPVGTEPGTETEVEHGVVVEKPHGGTATPPAPEVTTPTVPSTPDATTPTTPDPSEPEVEHPVPEPGDDHGVDAPGEDVGDDHGGDGGTPVAPTTQSFSSVGGSIVVSTDGTSLSLVSSTPATGYAVEVHDNGPTRVEVRFTSGGTEWRIRVELGAGGLVSEVTQHG